MSGTDVFYNGVLLQDCETKRWRQEIVKDSSGTDVLYSKVTLTVESTLVRVINGNVHPSTISTPLVNFDTMVDRWQEIQWRLQEHRKDFWLAVHGVTDQPSPPAGDPPSDTGELNESYRVVLAATGLTREDLEKMIGEDYESVKDVNLGDLDGFSDFGTGTPRVAISREKVIDLNNGPKPIEVVVEKVFGGQSLRVSLTIEICRCFCRPRSGSIELFEPAPAVGAGQLHGVISNKWSMTESMDSDFKTEHAVTGKLIVSDARYKPHALRLAVTPKMAPYFSVQDRKFETDPTGLILAYSYRSKETGTAPPQGCVTWNGTYSERAAPGGKTSADISVSVKGTVFPKNAGPGDPDPVRSHKAYLLAIAFRILRSRLRWSKRFNAIPGSDPTNTLLSDVAVIENMKEPEVMLRMSVTFTDDGFDNFGLRLKNMGASIKTTIPTYDARWWPIPDAYPWDTDGIRDDANFFDDGDIFDNYFQSPCSQWHAILESPKTEVQQDPLRDEGGGGPNIELNPDLTGTDPADFPPGVETNSEIVGWNATDGFSYLQCEIDTQYDIESGNVQLPLSKPRYPNGDTSLVLSLFAGVSQRTITMVATRVGQWPQVPSPKAVIADGARRETFIRGKTIQDVPKLTRDGKSLIYSSQVKWTYALNRQLNAEGDYFWAASDPRMRTTPATNKVKLSDYFTDGLIETA